MGVKGLQSYICHHLKQAKTTIDIREKIENWKSEHRNKPPILVIDVKEFSQIVVQRDEVGIICGGRHPLYISMFRKFLDNLKQTGVQITFFVPGKKMNDETAIFIPKREKEYEKYLNLLDRIDSGVPIRKILDQKNRRHPDKRATFAVEYNTIKVCRQFGDVYFNYYRHNQEIAQYALRQKGEVIAIISNDTDFMVFEGDWEFWSCNDIDLRDLTTTCYCREMVLNELELTNQQLGLVGALSGSEYLPTQVGLLKDFYTKIKNSEEGFSKIPDLAAYVRQINQIPTRNSEIVKFDLDKVATDIFGEDYSDEERNTIENGLATYNLNFRVTPVNNPFHRQLKRNDRLLYKLLTDDVFNIRDIMFIDFRQCNAKTYAELIVPILQRILGIIFSDNQNTGFSRKICIKYSHEEPYEESRETPCYPPMDLQIPFETLYTDRTTHLNPKKWQLLFWILSIDDSLLDEVKRLPREFLTPVVTLLYLVEQGEVTVVEADAILITERDARQNQMPRNMRYPRCLNGRFVRLAHLYTKIYELVCACFRASGLLMYSDFIKFDGAHFHNYLESFEGSSDMLTTMISPIDKFRLYANDK